MASESDFEVHTFQNKGQLHTIYESAGPVSMCTHKNRARSIPSSGTLKITTTKRENETQGGSNGDSVPA